ncbi:hypothetical protein G6O67_008832 [Ophiocordyceps sinensis]|uniref:Uncharacterized protein n=1 Tax=Ophiocordyceps sinensis TaxID=72228 RepID=A0A8H4LRL2_9HYPO|nr:hypothetical protein G6O67_008832 [Ophiocordyceps sinensis]
MPRFMFLIKADAMAEAAQAEIPTEIFEAMTKFNEHMAAEGILPAAEGFRPTAVDGYRVQGGSSLAWAKKVPFPQGELVVRRVGDCDDMGGGFTKALRERERRLRAKLEENRKAAGM